MISRIIVLVAVIAAMLLWVGPVPKWVMIGFVFAVLLPLGIAFSIKRMRLEVRLARTLWLALTRR